MQLFAPPFPAAIIPAVSLAGELLLRGHRVAWAVHRDLVPDALPAGAEIHALPAESNLDLGQRSSGVRGLESVKFFYEQFCLPLARASLEPLHDIVHTVKP